MEWASFAARMGEIRSAYKFLSNNQMVRNHYKDLCVDGGKILQLIFKKTIVWTGCIWLRIGTSDSVL
jgi:hypothetical protein